MQIKTVGVLGCGLMGSGIAQVAAASGYKTLVREVNQGVLDKGLGRMKKFLEDGVTKGKVTAEQRDTTLGNLSGVTDFAAMKDCDIVMMLQYATYSVISPEGCASILWKSAEKAPEAAESLGITASRLKTMGLIDRVITEPLGGAHRDPQAAAVALKKALVEALRQVQEKKPKQLVEERLERLMGYGKFKEIVER